MCPAANPRPAAVRRYPAPRPPPGAQDSFPSPRAALPAAEVCTGLPRPVRAVVGSGVVPGKAGLLTAIATIATTPSVTPPKKAAKIKYATHAALPFMTASPHDLPTARVPPGPTVCPGESEALIDGHRSARELGIASGLLD